MANPRTRAQIERARRRRRGSARAQRVALAVVAGGVLVVVLLLTAFSSGSTTANGPAVSAASLLLPGGPPQQEILALAGQLRIQLPIQQDHVTAIGYHGAGTGVVALAPLGTQGNPGFLRRVLRALVGGGSGSPRWYRLSGGTGPSTGALNVGAAPGTTVYAPVDGTIVAVTDEMVDGKHYGARIDIRPTATAGVIVSVSHVDPGEAVAVGAQVASGVTRLGKVVDLSHVERLALAQFTQDSGNHVEIEVRPAPSQHPAVAS